MMIEDISKGLGKPPRVEAALAVDHAWNEKRWMFRANISRPINHLPHTNVGQGLASLEEGKTVLATLWWAAGSTRIILRAFTDTPIRERDDIESLLGYLYSKVDEVKTWSHLADPLLRKLIELNIGEASKSDETLRLRTTTVPAAFRPWDAKGQKLRKRLEQFSRQPKIMRGLAFTLVKLDLDCSATMKAFEQLSGASSVKSTVACLCQVLAINERLQPAANFASRKLDTLFG